MITHTHEYAIEGALLECVAIKYALGGGDYDRGDEGFDETAFIAELLNCIPFVFFLLLPILPVLLLLLLLSK